MPAVMIDIFAPLLSLFIFILGTGFFSTLLALNMTLSHASPLAIGAMTGVFYAGLVLGSFRMDRFITRVGHIRAYAVFSATQAIICLLHGMFYHVGLWLFLRCLAGFVSVGLYIVIESWLLDKSTSANRGRVLSLYMISFYAAQSLGQFFLNLAELHTLSLFILTSMLCSLSIIPLAVSCVNPPKYEGTSTLNLQKLLNKSVIGFVGCLSSGLILGGIYGLMPTLLSDLFHDKAKVANGMFAVIFGGMLLQYPLGKLSDFIARRLVLIIIAVATFIVSVLLMTAHIHSWFFFMLVLLLGGLTFTLYPISISHACDSLDTRDIVAGTQSLLLAYSLGAMIGPLLAPWFMLTFGVNGLFIYFIAICSFITPFFILCKNSKVEQENPSQIG
jgi:MFS family permease